MYDEMIIGGVLASIVFNELVGISPGGIIVPGYIALLLDSPWRIVLTIALSLLTLASVRMLSKYMILFGKRRFAVFIIVSFLLRFLMEAMTLYTELSFPAIRVIGYLVPGILAHEMDRQGAVKTLSSMMIVALIIKIAFTLLQHGITP